MAHSVDDNFERARAIALIPNHTTTLPAWPIPDGLSPAPSLKFCVWSPTFISSFVSMYTSVSRVRTKLLISYYKATAAVNFC